MRWTSSERARRKKGGCQQEEKGEEIGCKDLKLPRDRQEVGRPQDREQGEEKDDRQEARQENGEEDWPLVGEPRLSCRGECFARAR